jgi:uncharacterized protein involved in tolerance to divalent cations
MISSLRKSLLAACKGNLLGKSHSPYTVKLCFRSAYFWQDYTNREYFITLQIKSSNTSQELLKIIRARG